MVKELVNKGLVAVAFSTLTLVLTVVSWKHGGSLVSVVAIFTAAFSMFSALLSLAWFVLKGKDDAANLDAKVNLSTKDQNLFDSIPTHHEKTLEHFRKILVPIVTVLAIGLVVYFGIRLWDHPVVILERHLQTAAITLLPIIASLLVGSYFIGISKMAGLRWFRACGGWLMVTAVIEAFALVSYLISYFLDLSERTDLWITRGFLILFVALSLDLLVGIFFTFYKVEETVDEQPAYESRILSVVFQPGGITKNVSELISYQFGLEVAEGWFITTIEKVVFPLVLVILTLMWLMTSLVFIPSNSKGIRERFGVVTSNTPLDAGVYFKLPYPFSTIKTFPIGEVQSFTLGQQNNFEFKAPEVLLWTKSHVSHETQFLLPEGNSGINGESEAISLLSAEIPVHYLVTDLYKYLYNFSDGKDVLKKTSQAVLVHYFAKTDFFKFLGFDRFKGADELKQSIQQQANALDLGIKIVSVSFVSVHPPVAVGAVFQQVSAAKEERATMIESAYAYQAEILPRVEGEAYRLLTLADSYREHKTKVAKAVKIRFLEQVKAFESSPEYVALVEEMKVIEQTAGKRKYILSKSLKQNIFTINLEDKLTPDLLDLNFD